MAKPDPAIIEEMIRTASTNGDRWYWQLVEAGKVGPLEALFVRRGYQEGLCIGPTLTQWDREGRTFANAAEIESALKTEFPPLKNRPKESSR